MEQEVRELEIINSRADDLNEEALDVLDYQVALIAEAKRSGDGTKCVPAK